MMGLSTPLHVTDEDATAASAAGDPVSPGGLPALAGALRTPPLRSVGVSVPGGLRARWGQAPLPDRPQIFSAPSGHAGIAGTGIALGPRLQNVA